MRIVRQKLRFPPAKGNSKADANTSWLVVRINSASIQTESRFDSKESFINKGNIKYLEVMNSPKLNPAALAHEQLHLDIGELVARSLKAEMKTYLAVVQIKLDGQAGIDDGGARGQQLLRTFALQRWTTVVRESSRVHGGFDVDAGTVTQFAANKRWGDMIGALLAKGNVGNPNDISPWSLLLK